MKEDYLLTINNMNNKEEEQQHQQTREDYSENEEADEEALSLCDLPISGDPEEKDSSTKSNHHHHHHHDGDQEDLFEFSSNTDQNSDSMSSAEDIIFCGKLLPYKSVQYPSLQQHQFEKKNLEKNQRLGHDDDRRHHHRRSESVGDLRRSQSSAKDRLVRSSYSLDYRKLQRGSSTKTSSPVRQTDRSFSAGRCFGKCEFPARRSSPARPRRWHLFTFGLMRTPVPEMELRDIRNRLSRRGPATMFQAFDGGETVSVKREEGKGSWRLLRAFGCKGQANTVVTASLGCIPHV